MADKEEIDPNWGYFFGAHTWYALPKEEMKKITKEDILKHIEEDKKHSGR